MVKYVWRQGKPFAAVRSHVAAVGAAGNESVISRVELRVPLAPGIAFPCQPLAVSQHGLGHGGSMLRSLPGVPEGDVKVPASLNEGWPIEVMLIGGRPRARHGCQLSGGCEAYEPI